MQLTSERLILRPVQSGDIDDLFRIYGDPATNQFNPAGAYPDRQHAESVLTTWLGRWRNNSFGMWAIAYRHSAKNIIGFGGLSLRNFQDMTINNLGYRFATEAWGKGLATEFSRRAIRFGFEDLTLKSISATVRENHLASQSVLIKSGLRLSGQVSDLPNASPSLIFTITAEDYYGKPNSA